MHLSPMKQNTSTPRTTSLLFLSLDFDEIWVRGSRINAASSHVKNLMVWCPYFSYHNQKVQKSPKQPFLALATTVCQHLLSGLRSGNNKAYMDRQLLNQGASMEGFKGSLLWRKGSVFLVLKIEPIKQLDFQNLH